jgi:hypothetical protein
LEASAGSYALLGAKPAVESSVISKLREAGVIILGKTNLSEWANFRGLDIDAGWSPRGGQTMGAYYPNSTPNGSSSGSAVAAALGLCTAAIGTEVSLVVSLFLPQNLTQIHRRLVASWIQRKSTMLLDSSLLAASLVRTVPSQSPNGKIL